MFRPLNSSSSSSSSSSGSAGIDMIPPSVSGQLMRLNTENEQLRAQLQQKDSAILDLQRSVNALTTGTSNSNNDDQC